MRIAVFVPDFPGLTETFVLNQVTGLIDRGHDVTVIAQHRPRMIEHPVVKEYRLIERTFYLGRVSGDPRTRFRKFFKLLRGMHRRPLLQILRGFNVFRYGRNALALRLSTFALRLNDVRDPFDAILCHYGPFGLLTQQLISIGAVKGPLAVVFHGFDLTSTIEQEGEGFYKPLFRTDTHLLPISDYFKQRLLNYGARQEQIRVHHMGVDITSLEYTERKFPEKTEPWHFISVGRFVEKKGFQYAIRAIARASNEIGPFRYDIIGDGELRPQMEVLIRKLGMEEQVFLHGWQDQEVVSEKLRQSHIMLQPSVVAADGNMEGIPVVLMEALAAGIPVISTRHSGIPELVRHKQTGFLVAERDVEGLSDMIISVTNSPNILPAIAENGRKLVEEEFNIHELNNQLEDILASLK